MKKKINNKVILAIELILIITGLVLSAVGAVRSLSSGLPGSAVPETAEGEEAPAAPTGEAPEGAPNQAAPQGVNPAGDPNQPAPMGDDAEPPAEGEESLDKKLMLQSEGTAFSYAIVYLIPVIVYILLLVYVLIEYRKPHGNLLRIILLIYAFTLAIWAAAQGENTGCVYILPCAAVIVSYLSGRLRKIRKNLMWISIAAVLLIGYGILQTAMIAGISYGILQFAYCFGAALQWITLALAYFVRYEEHILAGKEEAPAE